MAGKNAQTASDYAQVKDFAGHKNIIVTPIGEEPPENIIYTFWNSIYLLQTEEVKRSADMKSKSLRITRATNRFKT